MPEFPHYYLTLPSGALTQGDIWLDLPSPMLLPVSKVAIVITPRCDFAHEKTPSVNYIPAIGFDDYIEGALPMLLEREIARLDTQLRDLEIPLPVYEMLELGASTESIVEELGREAEAATLTKRNAADIQRFKENFQKITDLRKVIDSKIQDPTILGSLIPARELRKFREQLLKNQINDAHMLPPCIGISSQPLIFLLRHVTSCDIRCVQLAHSCLSVEQWESRRNQNLSHLTPLTAFKSMPERVARLKGPFLEQLVSRFVALFSRVGVPDLTNSEFTSLIGDDQI